VKQQLFKLLSIPKVGVREGVLTMEWGPQEKLHKPITTIQRLFRPKESNAKEAAEMAYNHAKSMTPGSSAYAQLMQLGLANEAREERREDVFLTNVAQLGFTLQVELDNFPVFDQSKPHTCVPIRGLTELIFAECPERLLGGFKMESLHQFQQLLGRFWACYRVYNGQHAVYHDKTPAERLQCIPVKIHTDEGTGLRKTPIYQYSWGPVIPKNVSSCNRYFYFTSIFHEQYRKHHAGYEVGNLVLDDVMGHMARQFVSMYRDGVSVGSTKFFLVVTGLEGDLPAQARVCHSNLFLIRCRTFQVFLKYFGGHICSEQCDMPRFADYDYLRQENMEQRAQPYVQLVLCQRYGSSVHRLEGFS